MATNVSLGKSVGKALVEMSEENSVSITFSFKRIPKIVVLTITERPENLLNALREAAESIGEYIKFKEEDFEGKVSFQLSGEVYLTFTIHRPCHLYTPIIDSVSGIDSLVVVLKKLPQT